MQLLEFVDGDTLSLYGLICFPPTSALTLLITEHVYVQYLCEIYLLPWFGVYLHNCSVSQSLYRGDMEHNVWLLIADTALDPQTSL